MTFLTVLLLTTAPLSLEESRNIGIRVWQNECGGTINGLVSWNEGEEFASLGIGHFIWYPAKKTGPYSETFPELIVFLKQKGVEIPRWIEEAHGCPWKNRDQFKREFQRNSKNITQLRRLLKETVPEQVQFLRFRLEKALPELLSFAHDDQKAIIKERYNRILSHPNGSYVLIDYVNFKGYGTSLDERYAGWGWGLFQVLEAMSDDVNLDPIEEFVKCAKSILERRVNNAPSQRNEQRYLQGWIYRLDSYCPKN